MVVIRESRLRYIMVWVLLAVQSILRRCILLIVCTGFVLVRQVYIGLSTVV